MYQGNMQGDMKPEVKDYQPKRNEYSQEQFGKTTEYISRRDAIQGREAKDIRKQDYKGRYE